jgi:uncharacterized protein YfaS (alpha-2-macroglobulin family)
MNPAIRRAARPLWAAWLPKRAAVVAALFGIGAAFAFVFSEETPQGTVSGMVVLDENHAPIKGVTITLTPNMNDADEENIRRQAVSNEKGQFTVSRLRAGPYMLSASTRAHDVNNAYLDIAEGGTTPITLYMSRSQAELGLAQHQRVFGTKEKARLPVRGYVDGKRLHGKDKLHLKLYRTRLSAILQNKAGGNMMEKLGGETDSGPSYKGETLPKEIMKPATGPAPQLVTEKDIPITEADREGFYYQRLQFGEMAPGLYLAEIGHAKQTVAAWLLVTDTALVLKKSSKQIMAYAVDLQTGTPVPGAAVRSFRNGKVVTQGRCDSQGLAWLNLPVKHKKTATTPDEDTEGGGGEDAQLMTIAVRGEDEAIVQRREYEQSEDEGLYKVHIYTDRPIYRPGQKVSYKGISRKTVDPGVRYALSSTQKVAVEVRDPEGERILQEQRTTNPFGSFAGEVTLSPEARTGVYTVVTKIGGSKQTGDFVVASYKKPEFEVKLTPTKKSWVRGETVEVNISAEYYFGTPVAGATVDYDTYSSTDWSAEYPEDYEYDESTDRRSRGYYRHSDYLGETDSNGSVRLDGNGKAVIQIKTKADSSQEAPQDNILSLSVRVKDDSSREVDAQQDVRVTAGDYHLSVRPEGYVAEPGKPSQVTLSARTYDGKPVPGVKISLESGYTKWNKKKRDEVFTRAGVQDAVTGADGRVTVTVVPPHKGELRLNARTTDTHGHALIARGYLWAAGDEGSDLDTQYDDLSILTDRRRYNAGETARVMVNASRIGQTVLVTVEGDRVYKAMEVQMKSHSAIMRVPVLQEYGPNVSLSACYVRDKHFATSETQLRVSTPARDIHVAIVPDRKSIRPGDARPTYHPQEKISYQVRTTDSSGKPVPAEFSFAVVDESIYALREDDPAALRDTFYPRRENSVTTSYSFAVEYLGDANKAEPQITARKKFPDTAYWEPMLRTDAQGHATVSFQLPDNLTTWRATAVAQTADTAFGRETNKVLETKDFFVRLETPRFLTQRDQSHIQAIVHNETGAEQKAIVRLRTEGVVVAGDTTQTVTVPAGKTSNIEWQVTAGDLAGARIDVAAWTPKSGTRPQFTDRIETRLPIRPHGREEFIRFAGVLSATQPETEVFHLDALAVPSASRLTVRVTPSVSSAMVGALDYLIGFPYGCTEQTMSRFLPDVLVQRLGSVSRPLLSGDEAKANALPIMIRDGLARLSRFQHKTGAWGWWENDPDDPWMTAYVIYGMATAKASGIKVSQKVLDRAVAGGIKMVSTVNDENEAFLLYALALTGNKEAIKTAGIVRQSIKVERQGVEGLAYLVLLDKLLGRSPEAAFHALEAKAVRQDGMMHWAASSQSYHGWDERMVTAAALRAMIAVNKQDSRINEVLQWLMAHRTGEYWEDTRDTAWVLAALCDYLAVRPDVVSPSGEIVLKVNNKAVNTYHLTPSNVREPELIARIPAGSLAAGKNVVTLERTGGTSPVFYSMEMRQTVAREDMAAVSKDKIKIEREYLRLTPTKAGSDYYTLQTEATKNHLRSGDQIRVKLTITVPKDLTYVLIEDPFPAGCEVTERGTADETTDWSYWWSSVDIRDDRIAFFARSMPKGEHIIEYNLRAQTPGQYHTLPTFLQAMYAPEIQAWSPETRVDIK